MDCTIRFPKSLSVWKALCTKRFTQNCCGGERKERIYALSPVQCLDTFGRGGLRSLACMSTQEGPERTGKTSARANSSTCISCEDQTWKDVIVYIRPEKATMCNPRIPSWNGRDRALQSALISLKTGPLTDNTPSLPLSHVQISLNLPLRPPNHLFGRPSRRCGNIIWRVPGWSQLSEHFAHLQAPSNKR